MRRSALVPLAAVFAMVLVAATPKGEKEARASRLTVIASKDSKLIRLQVESPRRIGEITIEVRDDEGRTWYKEEGKASGQELVRYLDKRILPIGHHTVLVTTRDLQAHEVIAVE